MHCTFSGTEAIQPVWVNSKVIEVIHKQICRGLTWNPQLLYSTTFTARYWLLAEKAMLATLSTNMFQSTVMGVSVRVPMSRRCSACQPAGCA